MKKSFNLLRILGLQLVTSLLLMNYASASIIADFFDFTSDPITPAEQTQVLVDKAEDLLEFQRESIQSSNSLTKINWRKPKVVPLRQSESAIDSVYLVSQSGSTLTRKTHSISVIVRISGDSVESSLPVSIDQVREYIPVNHADTILPSDSNG